MESEKSVEMLIEDLLKMDEHEMDEETLEIVINEMILAMLF
jgi:hypothetical protein